MGLLSSARVAAAHALLGAELRARIARLRFDDAGHGYDRLGMSRDAIAVSLAATRFLYETWFRVDSAGIEHVPAAGPAILTPNHSGTLPVDGMMIWVDVLRRCEPPRALRAVADVFVPRLPFVYTWYSRNGVVAGNRATVERLLRDGELVLIFPEGVPGIAKPRSKRYQVQEFRVGHAELAIRHQAPIVPVAVIGAEEQWPELTRLEGFHPFGAPYVPIPSTPVPLPVKYRIRYGAPIDPRGRFGPDEADDPQTARLLASEAERAVQALINEGLAERKGIFER